MKSRSDEAAEQIRSKLNEEVASLKQQIDSNELQEAKLQLSNATQAHVDAEDCASSLSDQLSLATKDTIN